MNVNQYEYMNASLTTIGDVYLSEKFAPMTFGSVFTHAKSKIIGLISG